MTTRKLTCIVCPVGCDITVTLDGKEVVSVEGNTCKRGEDYARNECVAPKRTVTSIMSCTGGGVVSVKTDRAIPKDKVMDCMKIINAHKAVLPVAIGDVIIEDIFGSNIVATRNKK